MAFIPEDDEGSEEAGMNVLAGEASQQQPEVSQEPSTGVPLAGAAAPILGSQAAPVPFQGTRKQKGSGMFTNIRKYIEANKPAATKIAGAITGGLKKQAAAITKQKDIFQQNLAQSQQKLQQAQQFGQQAIEQAGTGTLTDPDFQRFQDITTGKTQFGIPQPINLLNQRARAQALQRLSQRAGRAEGRDELLRQTFGQNRRYTRGQRSIDALILGASPEATQQVTEATKEQYGGLVGDITQARKQAVRDIYGLKQNIGAFTGAEGQAAQDILGEQGARTQLGETLDVAAQSQLDTANIRRNELISKLNLSYDPTQALTPEEFAELGISEDLQKQFADVNLGQRTTIDYKNYLEGLDPKQYTRESIADPTQRARFDALSKLVGREGLGEGATPELKLNLEQAMRDIQAARGQTTAPVQGGSFDTGDQMNLLAMITAPGSYGASKVLPKVLPKLAKYNPVTAPLRIFKNPIKKIFCFTAGNLVKMVDGSMKKIEEIGLGEKVWLGGEVNAIGQAYANDIIYEYKGSYVTGSHAVFEDGEWGRVEESPYAIPTDMPENTIVYPMANDNHLIVVNDFISADYSEIDIALEMDQHEKIDFLNNDYDRNQWLLEEEKRLQGGQ